MSQRRRIAQSGLFDANWYGERNGVAGDPIAHYVATGAGRGLWPHPLFDAQFYQALSRQDVDGAATPLERFLSGQEPQLSPHPLFEPDWYRRAAGLAAGATAAELFRHFVTEGGMAGISPHPLFDAAWYYEQAPDLAKARVNPLTHFVESGHLQGRNPNRLFDVAWYRHTYGAHLAPNANPLLHFMQSGCDLGFQPSPAVDLALYRACVPGAPQAGLAAFVSLVTRDAERYFALVRGADAAGQGIGHRPDGRWEDAGLKGQADPAAGRPGKFKADAVAGLLAHLSHDRAVVEWGFGNLDVTAARAEAAWRGGALTYRVLSFDPPGALVETLNMIRSGITGEAIDSEDDQRPWLPYWSEADARRRLVVNASLYERDIRNKLGAVDIIIAHRGVEYERDPPQLLRRLAWLTAGHAIVYAPVIAPFVLSCAGETVRFGTDDLWPAEGLSTAQAAALDQALRRQGVELEQFAALRKGGAWAPRRDDPAAWAWFIGEAALERLLAKAGLETVEVTPAGRGHGRWRLVQRVQP